ncbi:MAG: ATP-dependent Clp protease adaptor protein ClpS, partial [uncultured Solirubrobacteraceae bacterium]
GRSDHRAPADRRTRLRAGRRVEGDRPQRRPQHVRPRGVDPRPLHPGRHGRQGLRDGRPDPHDGPGHRVDGAEGDGRALLGAALRRGAHDGPARARL